jgi:hypothetical protein
MASMALTPADIRAYSRYVPYVNIPQPKGGVVLRDMQTADFSGQQMKFLHRTSLRNRVLLNNYIPHAAFLKQ